MLSKKDHFKFSSKIKKIIKDCYYEVTPSNYPNVEDRAFL